jgi:hypothetical protein
MKCRFFPRNKLQPPLHKHLSRSDSPLIPKILGINKINKKGVWIYKNKLYFCTPLSRSLGEGKECLI